MNDGGIGLLIKIMNGLSDGQRNELDEFVERISRNAMDVINDDNEAAPNNKQEDK